jgi:hypothetical protein
MPEHPFAASGFACTTIPWFSAMSFGQIGSAVYPASTATFSAEF